MVADVHVTQLDVLKVYNNKLRGFRNIVWGCGALIDKQIRNIKSDVDSKLSLAKHSKQGAAQHKDSIVRRYQPIRKESIPGSEVAGTTDYDVQTKYTALESAVNNYEKSITELKNKMSEIGQLTKTFCTNLDTEVQGSNAKLDELIAIMDDMTNHKISNT